MTDEAHVKPGDKVRLISNPERIGIMGNETEGKGRRQRVLVTFLDGTEDYMVIGSLEKAPVGKQSPEQLLRRGTFESAGQLRKAITYYRLNGRLANLIYSLNATNTDFYAYQFKPVLKFLDSLSGGILIADEVGLGKTIEAGLIWTELQAREDARRLLVVCPAMLCEKWQLELKARFGVKAEIVNAAELTDRLAMARKAPEEPLACIVSIQGIRPPKHWESISEADLRGPAKLARLLDDCRVENPLFNLVIVDEAHQLKNASSASHAVARLLRNVTEHMVLLSATPIQLKSLDLFNLLNLLDSDAFPLERTFERLVESSVPLVSLRDELLRKQVKQKHFRKQLAHALQNSTYRGNQQLKSLFHNPPTQEVLDSREGRLELADKLERVNPLNAVISRTRKRDVMEHQVIRQPKILAAKMTAVEENFYDAVTARVREYCTNTANVEGFMLTIPQRQIASCMQAAYRGWLERTDGDDFDEALQEFFDDEVGSASKANLGDLLRQLINIARDLNVGDSLYQQDTKFNLLLKSLQGYWRSNPDKKVVLFSFYKNTLYYLNKRLTEHGIESEVLHGGMDKQAVIEHFKSEQGPQIILSSEVAAEGVDLQFSSLLVNYDLPWNPAKLEQRIGRIDRIGQTEKSILIWNMVYKDTIDERICDRLITRLDTFRQALGDMGDVLGQSITRLSRDLLMHRLTPAQENERIESVQMAIEKECQAQEQLEQAATQLIAHGDFIQNKVRAANELGRYVRNEDLLAYASDFVQQFYEGSRMIAGNDPLHINFEPSVQLKADLNEFLTQHKLRGASRMLGTDAPTLVFDGKGSNRQFGQEVVGQSHPLIRFVAAKYKAMGDSHVEKVCALQAPCADAPGNPFADDHGGVSPGYYHYSISRWSVSGAKVIEILSYTLVDLNSGARLTGDWAESLVNYAALHSENWFSADDAIDLDDLAELYADERARTEQAFSNFIEDQRVQNLDRINLSVALLEHRIQQEKIKEEEQVARLIIGSNQRMIPATKAKYKKSRDNLEAKIAELKLKEKLDGVSVPVSFGVVRFY